MPGCYHVDIYVNISLRIVTSKECRLLNAWMATLTPVPPLFHICIYAHEGLHTFFMSMPWLPLGNVLMLTYTYHVYVYDLGLCVCWSKPADHTLQLLLLFFDVEALRGNVISGCYCRMNVIFLWSIQVHHLIIQVGTMSESVADANHANVPENLTINEGELLVDGASYVVLS